MSTHEKNGRDMHSLQLVLFNLKNLKKVLINFCKKYFLQKNFLKNNYPQIKIVKKFASKKNIVDNISTC